LEHLSKIILQRKKVKLLCLQVAIDWGKYVENFLKSLLFAQSSKYMLAFKNGMLNELM
jgi:hypothetical protein